MLFLMRYPSSSSLTRLFFALSLVSFYLLSTKIAVEAQHGLIAQVIKDVIFSMRPRGEGAASAAAQVSDVTDMAIG